MRKFRVDLSTTVEILVDDDVVGEFDGKSILDPTSERWTPGLTEMGVVGALATAIVNDARIGGSDGFADLPEDTVRGLGWPVHHVDNVEEVT